MAAARPRLPGGVRQHRPRPQRLPHRGAARHGAGGARPPAAGRRRPVRPDRLQAAVRRADPAGAGRDRPLARVPRRRGDSRGRSRLQHLLAFGPDVWHAFFGSAHLTRVEVLEQGGTGWHKIQSVFSMVRMWGGGVPLAYAAQGAVTIALAAALIWLWRSAATYRAEGRSADRRVDPRHALQPRLRPRDARPGDCLPRRRRPRAAASRPGRKTRWRCSGSCR